MWRMYMSEKRIGIPLIRLLCIAMIFLAGALCLYHYINCLRNSALLQSYRRYDSCALDVNLKILQCFILNRQHNLKEHDNFQLPRQDIPSIEFVSGSGIGNRKSKILIINNTNKKDWSRSRKDAVLSVCAMPVVDDFFVFVVVHDGIWVLRYDDATVSLICDEINRNCGKIENCSADAMGLVDCNSGNSVMFFKSAWHFND